ncbi:LemA family protein [Apibacter sp. B3889]|uniref:LemA family protein n=1 Tax=unclassified Apibacter TaxID=2630820 RepID=UPI001328674A|nr:MULTISPECIES: LemA family protein [unclassified Apibacter]MXO32356.1 LemA family protein [Apibacter sp. B2912]MXO33705.1 LemA family protein [Apibacter sp. B3883]MXO41062.1 LemA family protein [Apibacter sp. B3889]MXP04231.1 LemA family protein [Apibacter sp. B3887]MXP06958.1 LemA family protein [Apibacter sp. B3935]
MKKGCLIGGGIIGLIAIIVIGVFMWGVSINNNMIELNNDVNLKWSAVESSYQRRSDLVPGLVATVNKATNYEKETLTSVIEARAKASSVQIDPSNLSPEKLAEYQKAQSGLGSALGRLLVTIEKYPDLKANQNILGLQNQLEGTENRIKIDRDNFNQSVTTYNNYIQKFPASIVANFRNFKEKGTFKADAGAEKAPNVDQLLNGK